MNHLHRFLARGRIVADGQEPRALVRQLRHQRPVLGTDLAAPGHRPGIRRPAGLFAQPHQPQHDPPQPFLRIRAEVAVVPEPREHGLRVIVERALEPALAVGAAIGRPGEPPVLLLGPQPLQGKLQQGQAARPPLHGRHQLLGKPVLEADAEHLRRLAHRLRQIRRHHRSELHVCVPEQARQRADLQGLSHEVRPQRRHRPDHGGVRVLRHNRLEHPQQLRLAGRAMLERRLVRPGQSSVRCLGVVGEQLLELIDDQKHPSTRTTGFADDVADAARIGPQALRPILRLFRALLEGIRRQARKRCQTQRQLAQRIALRPAGRDLPSIPLHLWQQACPHHRRLARA